MERRPTWTRKTYDVAAGILRDIRENGGDRQTVARIALQFANAFAADNPNFDRTRFAESVWPEGRS